MIPLPTCREISPRPDAEVEAAEQAGEVRASAVEAEAAAGHCPGITAPGDGSGSAPALQAGHLCDARRAAPLRPARRLGARAQAGKVQEQQIRPARRLGAGETRSTVARAQAAKVQEQQIRPGGKEDGTTIVMARTATAKTATAKTATVGTAGALPQPAARRGTLGRPAGAEVGDRNLALQ